MAKTTWLCISAALALGQLQVVGLTRNGPFSHLSYEAETTAANTSKSSVAALFELRAL